MNELIQWDNILKTQEKQRKIKLQAKGSWNWRSIRDSEG